MSTIEQLVELVSNRVTSSTGAEEIHHVKRRARRFVLAAIRTAKIVALMVMTAIVIPITMISFGLLFGPKGYEGLILAPLSILVSWALILFFAMRGRPSPARVTRARRSELPVEAAAWLSRRRALLPREAHLPLDRIVDRLEALEVPLKSANLDEVTATRLRKLVADDLMGLVEHYKKLPPHLQTEARHGGVTPRQHLIDGLKTIGAELGRIQDRVSADDLRSLATKQRYLELKYDRKGEE